MTIPNKAAINAQIVATAKAIETAYSALETAQTQLSALAALVGGMDPDESLPVPARANDDPALCGHPDDSIRDVGGQRICFSCGTNLSALAGEVA